MVLIIMDTYSNILVFSIYLLLASVVIHLQKCYQWRIFVCRIVESGHWMPIKSELTRLDFSSSGDSLLRDETVTLDEDILRPLDFAIYNDTLVYYS